MIIKQLCEKNGMTLADVAAQTGLSVGVLNQYMYGNRNLDCAKIETLVKLALALNCKLTELLSEDLKNKVNSVV